MYCWRRRSDIWWSSKFHPNPRPFYVLSTKSSGLSRTRKQQRMTDSNILLLVISDLFSVAGSRPTTTWRAMQHDTGKTHMESLKRNTTQPLKKRWPIKTSQDKTTWISIFCIITDSTRAVARLCHCWSVRLEQSSGPCPQTHRSCFQALAKDIFAGIVLPHLANWGGRVRYRNLHIDINMQFCIWTSCTAETFQCFILRIVRRLK